LFTSDLTFQDELKIPLEFETIPTPKEFKEKISSISPEQQRFAKAIRSYQLAGSLFGMLLFTGLARLLLIY
jgi:hypothetical protein